MTFARLGIWDDKPYMVIAKGETVELPPEEAKALNDQTDPTWPHAHVRLESSFQEFLTVFPCNHIQGMVGDRVRALTYLCEITGITPIVLGDAGQERLAPLWERLG